MKLIKVTTILGLLVISQIQASDVVKEQVISRIEDRKSFIVNKSSFKKNFSGGEVRVDFLYPKSNAKTHSGAYVTFEPGARSNWHTHPEGQHIIVTSGLGYTQYWNGKKEIIKAGDVVWCPKDVKHWHGASKDIAMKHLVVTGADKNGNNVNWMEIVSDEQYNSK